MITKAHHGKRTIDKNYRHQFQMSAVKEFCVCGKIESDRVHSKAKAKAAKDVWKDMVIQVGIDPDTPMARSIVASTMGWEFETHEDEGVWLVTAPRWPEGQCFEGSISVPRSALPAGAPEAGIEVAITVDWP